MRTGEPLEAILRAVGGDQDDRATTETFPTFEQLQARFNGTLESTYRYTNPDTGKVDLYVSRLRRDGAKTFRQAHCRSDGLFVMKGPPRPWPLYNRLRVRDAEMVVVVEGEKCVHIMHELGIVATTSPMGSGKAKYADWSILAGKRVVLWPDNDPSGQTHMDDVHAMLARVVPNGGFATL